MKVIRYIMITVVTENNVVHLMLTIYVLTFII